MSCTAYAGVIPSCVRGSAVLLSEDGQARYHLSDLGNPEQLIDHSSDEELALHIRQTRAVSPLTVDGVIVWDVECLPPLAAVAPTL